MTERGPLRIGELSKRVGESPELLRAWETRYGLVAPSRTPGGLRLYSEQDERRVRVMRHHINSGLSAAEAARMAKLADEEPPHSAEPVTAAELAATLQTSFDTLDEPAAQAALDSLLVGFGVRPALEEVILPFLSELGRRWSDAQASVPQEHFASNVIGGRLRSLARGWGHGGGPVAILACPPGEQHELGLLSFGLVLRERGWRIVYLGADTPLGEIPGTVRELTPAILVLAAMTSERFLGNAGEIRTLSSQMRVGLAGPGASLAVARKLKAESLAGGVVEVADSLRP